MPLENRDTVLERDVGDLMPTMGKVRRVLTVRLELVLNGAAFYPTSPKRKRLLLRDRRPCFRARADP